MTQESTEKSCQTPSDTHTLILQVWLCDFQKDKSRSSFQMLHVTKTLLETDQMSIFLNNGWKVQLFLLHWYTKHIVRIYLE